MTHAEAAQKICDIRNALGTMPISERPLFLELLRAAEASLMGNDAKAGRLAVSAVMDNPIASAAAKAVA